MKRLSVLLSLILVLALSSAVFGATFVDGQYEGYSDASAKSFNYVKIFVEDGKIVAAILREFTNKHVEKDFAVYPWEDAKKAAQTMGLQIVENQGPADVVTGATGSSNGYNQALLRAMVKASANKPAKKYFDGTFLGRSHVASRGYYEVVWVTIKDDKITDIQFQRVQPDYTILDPADYNYPLVERREDYKNLAIEQNSGNLDTISGATGLTEMLNIAVQDALSKALIQ